MLQHLRVVFIAAFVSASGIAQTQQPLTTAVTTETARAGAQSSWSAKSDIAITTVHANPPPGDAISINFVAGGYYSGTPAPLAPSDVAGVAPASHWNNVADNLATGNASNLVDNSGAVTGASINWSSEHTWSTQITTTDPNSRMMKGYLDNAGLAPTKVVVTGIPYAQFSIYVYFSGDNQTAGTVGSYTLNNSTRIFGRVDAVQFTGTFMRATGTSASDADAVGNYVLFQGISGSTFTVLAEPIVYTAPINGLQIVQESGGPTVTAITNAASFLPGSIAPGEIVSVFGSGMGPREGATARLNPQGRVDNLLAGTQVLFDGVPAPLFFVRADQINAQVPYSIAGKSSSQFQVVYEGTISNQLTSPVAPSAPGILVYPDGSNRAIAINQNDTLNSPSNPAASGEIIVLYATGEGQTEPPGEDGKLTAGAPPYPHPVLSPSLSIGGLPAEILYAGSAPGFAGLMQVNARISVATPGGIAVPVSLRVGSASSQPGVTMAIAPNSAIRSGKAYVNNFRSNSVSVIDTGTDTTVGTIEVGSGPGPIRLIPNSAKAYVGNYNQNTISVISIATDTVIRTITVGSGPCNLVVTPNGAKAYVTNINANSVSVIDTANDAVVKTLPVGTQPCPIAMSPTGSKIIVANRASNSLSVIDATTDVVTKTISVGSTPYAVAFTPNGAKAYVANISSDSVSVIDTTRDAEIKRIPVRAGPSDIAVKPDGSKVYVPNSKFSLTLGSVTVIDVASDTVSKTVSIGGFDASVVAWAPNGSKAYVAHTGSPYALGDISVIDGASETVGKSFAVGNRPVTIAFTLDGGKAYVANTNSASISVIETRTDTETKRVPVGNEPVDIAIVPGVGASPQVSISPSSGTAGTQFAYQGSGFTGNSGVTSHLRRPDGSEFPTLQIATSASGQFTNTINSTGFAMGTYQVWAVDNNTGISSNVVSFNVAAPQAGMVRVLYVTPQDRAPRSEYAAAVQNAMVDLQSWYAGQLSGKTFSLFSIQPETCRLPQSADYYASDSWSKVLSDVQGCAPVSYNSSTFVWVLYVDIVHACDAPGRLGAGTNGVTMMPRQDMDGLIGARYFDDCGREYRFPPSRYIGGAGHELGHAFGLPHPPGCDAGLATCDQNALMWSGYVQYPATYLRPEEKQFLLATPFFLAQVAKVSVTPSSGTAGTQFTYQGSGFTGNSGVTSHLRRPNGTEFPTLQIGTNASGQFTSGINSTGFAAGTYQAWAIDNNTGVSSNVAGFTVSPAAPPQITSISPTSGTQGQTITSLTVLGSNFQSGSTVSVSGTGIAVNSYSLRTSTQIVASITIANTAATGPRNVTVINPDSQSATLSSAFQVLASPANVVIPISIGQTVNGSLSSSDGRSTGCSGCYANLYEYNLNLPPPPGVDVAILLESSDFDAQLRLIGSNGAVLAANNDGVPLRTDALIRFFQGLGKFRIEASSRVPGVGGSYRLTVRLSQPFYGNTSTGHTSTGNLNIWNQLSTYCTGCFANLWDFGVTSSPSATVSVTSDSFAPYLKVWLWEPGRQQFRLAAENGNPQRGRTARATLSSGTYRMEVTSHGPAVGAYSLSIQPEVSLLGSVSDPAGDPFSVPEVSVSPDLTSGSITVAGGTMTLRARFAPGTFNTQTTFLVFFLDTDQNSSTGHRGSDSGGVEDAGIIGSEYVVSINNPWTGNSVARYAGCLNCFTNVGVPQVSFVSNGADLTVPLSMLGNDDGKMNFKITCAVRLGPANSSPTLDKMPNVGLPPGVVQ